MQNPAPLATLAWLGWTLALLAPASGQVAPDYLIVAPPAPAAEAAFGTSAAWLDWDGDGDLDLAVGAMGQSRVYVLLSDGHPSHPTLTPAGPPLAPPGAQASPDRFGRDLAAAQLDGDAADELVVGASWRDHAGVAQAGAVYVFGLDPDPSVALELRAPLPEVGALGESVCIADFDADGLLDVAAGAPATVLGGVPAGVVRLYYGPLGANGRTAKLGNPAGAIPNGNYGHELATSDLDGDGRADLVVSAIGNPASGTPVAGEVYVHIGPLRPPPTGQAGALRPPAKPGLLPIPLHDPWPDANDLPGPRYGMSVAARGSVVLVGANRKDWPDASGTMDAGVGFRFQGPPFGPPVRLLHPTPMQSDLFGIDCAIAELTGDATPDLVFSALPESQPLALFLWNGAQLAPPLQLLAPRGAGDHFANSLVAGQFIPGGHEELAIGDPTYDPAGGPPNAGRVAVLVGIP